MVILGDGLSLCYQHWMNCVFMDAILVFIHLFLSLSTVDTLQEPKVGIEHPRFILTLFYSRFLILQAATFDYRNISVSDLVVGQNVYIIAVLGLLTIILFSIHVAR